MPISSWLLPVLWREHDWRASLDRVATELAKVETSSHAQRAAVELGQASEYIEPDRRRAIAAYELGGDGLRARELAVELGWWAARARLSLAARATNSDPRLVLDEAEAWWDAGQPALCALALAGARTEARGVRADDLTALIAGRDLATATRARAQGQTGVDAAAAYVSAARFAHAAGRKGEVGALLEAALAAAPGHAIAARWLLSIVLDTRDTERIRRCVQVRLAGLDATARIDGMRACALALIDSVQHKGFGLRVLRQALELAYEAQPPHVPGHLAMWAVLVTHATADGTRLELLPLVIRGLQSSQQELDRVWLGALATELSLRDAKNPVVAGAYAEIVAEHAPEHPFVRELVAAVAAAPVAPTAVPPAAVAAAAQAELEASIDIEFSLDDAYAEAAVSAIDESEHALRTQQIRVVPNLRATQEIEVIQVVDEHTAPHVVPGAGPTKPPPGGKPAAQVAAAAAKVQQLPKVAPGAPEAKGPTKPAPVPVAAKTPPGPPPAPAPKAPPGPVAKAPPAPTAKPAAVTPPKPNTPAPAKPAKATSGPLPSIARALPVLTALRTPDRPVLPPRPATRPDALPRARRIAMPIDLTLVLPDGTRISGHSRDISTSGLFVLTTTTLTLSSELGVELLLPGAEAFTEDEYKARARVARRAEGGYGIELVDADAALIKALAAL